MMIFQYFLLAIGLALIIAMLRKPKTEKKPPSVNTRDLREVAELATVEYTIKKIVKHSDSNIFGQRKILFSAKAIVKAGVRVNNISSSKVIVDKEKNSVELNLPKTEILSFNMPPEDISGEYEHVGLLRKKFDANERNKFLGQGEDDIRRSVDTGEIRILEDAEKNAADFFDSMLKYVGFETVNINFEK